MLDAFLSDVKWMSNFTKHDQRASNKVAKRQNVSPENMFDVLVTKHLAFDRDLRVESIDFLVTNIEL